MKKFACVYRHWGKEHTMKVRARDFDHAKEIIEAAFQSGNYSSVDFEDDFDYDEQTARIRSARYNGEIEQVILSIPLP